MGRVEELVIHDLNLTADYMNFFSEIKENLRNLRILKIHEGVGLDENGAQSIFEIINVNKKL